MNFTFHWWSTKLLPISAASGFRRLNITIATGHTHTHTHRLVTRLMLETLAWGRGLRLRLSRWQQRTCPLRKTMNPLPQHPQNPLCSTTSSLMSKLCTCMLVFLLCTSTQGGCVTEKKPPSNERHIIWLVVQHGWNGSCRVHTHYTLSSQYICYITCYLGNI